jgi:methylated-DNA-protein-cysteine methyltransferase related protein
VSAPPSVDPGAGFRARVLAVVRAIPAGQVATYGQVALMVGAPRAARQVGGVLYRSGDEPGLPWHRVVNAAGGISTHKVGAGALQEALLRAEGIPVGPRGVDLQRYGWRPAVEALSSGLGSELNSGAAPAAP